MRRQVCGEGKAAGTGDTLQAQGLHFNFKTNTLQHTPLADLKKKRLAFSVKSGEIEAKLYLTSEACLNYTCNQNPCATATCNMQRVQQQQQSLQLAARAAHTYKINHNNKHCPSATDSLKCWARHHKPHTHTEHTHTLASSLRFWITSSYICGLLGNLLDYHCGLRPTHAGWEGGRNKPTQAPLPTANSCQSGRL